jgi:hypothetical protein
MTARGSNGDFPSFEEFKLEVVRRAEAAYKAASPPDDKGGIAVTLASLAYSYTVTSQGVGLDLETALDGVRRAWETVLSDKGPRPRSSS